MMRNAAIVAESRVTSDQRRESLSGSLWFIPLVTTVGALHLGGLLARARVPAGGPIDPILFHGDAEEARRLLLSVATATVGVFAVVVGLTLVSLQVAASRYSPRLVRSFLRDRPTQVVLGLFIATFAYNAAGLYTVDSDTPEGGYPRVAVTVGLALLFVCIGALVYYIDRVAHSIQIHAMLEKIRMSAVRAIRFEPPGIGRRSGLAQTAGPPDTATSVPAHRSGYVQRLRTDSLVREAANQGVVITFAAGIGGHVVAGCPLAWIVRDPTSSEYAIEPLRSAITRSTTVGAARSSHHDVAISIIQIVDVALVSMHVFDFHTVEQCADDLTVVLCDLASRPLGVEEVADDAGRVRVVVPGHTFAKYLDLACGEIRRRGASEPTVMLALVNMLVTVAGACPAERLPAVRRHLDLVRTAAERSIEESSDRELVLREVDLGSTVRNTSEGIPTETSENDDDHQPA
jgi:uncharacterized membrane protein